MARNCEVDGFGKWGKGRISGGSVSRDFGPVVAMSILGSEMRF